MAESIEAHPSQFQYSLSITGMSVDTTFSGPGASGVGMQVTTVGGSRGSQTTGLQVDTTVGPVQIQAGEDTKITHQAELIGGLRELADLVEDPKVSMGLITKALEFLRGRLAPDLIISIASGLVTGALPHLH
jgi:hypothetical protein